MAIGQKYHITQTADGKWQVKGAKAERALKLFNTQKEAIDYAKTVAGNQEGNIVIHKTDGKIRKQDYSKKSETQSPAAKQAKSPEAETKTTTKEAKTSAKEVKQAKAATADTKPAKDVKPAKTAPAKGKKPAAEQTKKQKPVAKKTTR